MIVWSFGGTVEPDSFLFEGFVWDWSCCFYLHMAQPARLKWRCCWRCWFLAPRRSPKRGGVSVGWRANHGRGSWMARMPGNASGDGRPPMWRWDCYKGDFSVTVNCSSPRFLFGGRCTTNEFWKITFALSMVRWASTPRDTVSSAGAPWSTLSGSWLRRTAWKICIRPARCKVWGSELELTPEALVTLGYTWKKPKVNPFVLLGQIQKFTFFWAEKDKTFVWSGRLIKMIPKLLNLPILTYL